MIKAVATVLGRVCWVPGIALAKSSMLRDIAAFPGAARKGRRVENRPQAQADHALILPDCSGLGGLVRAAGPPQAGSSPARWAHRTHLGAAIG